MKIIALGAALSLLVLAGCSGEESRDVKFLRELDRKNISLLETETGGAIRFAKLLCDVLKRNDVELINRWVPGIVQSVGPRGAREGITIAVDYYCPEEQEKIQRILTEGNFF